MRRVLGAWVVALGLLAASGAWGQRLAQRNWEGSGLTAQAWWPRAVFCAVDLRRGAGDGLKGVTARLDALQAIGCDAVELGMLGPEAGGSPVPLAFGTVEDADALLDELGRRKMRLVLDLPVAASPDAASPDAASDRMRFWLSRGVAGFRVSGASAETLRKMRQVTALSLGTRVLIGDGEGLQLAVRRVEANASVQGLRLQALRTMLAGSGQQALPVLAVQGGAAATRLEAAILLANGAAAILPAGRIGVAAEAAPEATEQRQFSAEELRLWIPRGAEGDASAADEGLVEWYKTLGELHHANAALRTGAATFLDRDSQGVLAWVVRPKGAGAPLAVVCNLSGHVVQVAMGNDLRRLGIKGTFFRTLLRSDADTAAPKGLDGIEVGANGVWIGELR